MAFSFRFYGRRPSRWPSGYLKLQLWEICFRVEPTSAQKESLARLYEQGLATGPAQKSIVDPWMWSGRFARVGMKEVEMQKLFSRAAEFFADVHAICAIDDVVFWGRGGDGRGAWQDWSVARQASPTPGPAYPDQTSPRDHDASLPDAAPDPAFEAARLAVRRADRDAEVAAMNEGAAVRLVRVEGDTLPPTLPDARALLPDLQAPDEGFELFPLSQGNRFVFVGAKDRDRRLYVLSDGALLPVDFGDEGLAYATAVHASGDRAVTAIHGGVAEVDLVGRVARKLLSEATPVAVDYAGDLWVIRTIHALMVVDPSVDPPKLLATAKGKGSHYGSVGAFRGGTIVVTGSTGKVDKTVIYGLFGGKLKRLAIVPIRGGGYREVDGRIVLHTGRDEFHALEGVDEIYEAWAGPLRRKAEKRKAGGSKRTPAVKLALEPRDSLPPAQVTSVREDDRFEGRIYACKAADLTLAVVIPDSDAPNERTLAYAVGEGAATTIPQASLDALGARGSLFRGPHIADSGAMGAFVQDNGLVVVVEASTGNVSSHFWERGNRGDVAQIEFPRSDVMIVRWEPPGWAKNTKARRIEMLRAREGGWELVDSVVVTKSHGMAVSTDVVAVTANAANRLVLYAIDEDGLIKVGSFKDRVSSARFDLEGRLFVQTPEGQALEVTGLATIVAKKRAAAAKKRGR